MAAQLSILSKDVRVHDDMYSLNDLHKAAGSEQKHKPALFLRHQQTQELIEEIEKGTDSYLLAVVTVKGRNGGTYVCKELVHAYAMWISPKFHLHVIRAFDQMVSQPKPQQVIGSEGMRCLSALIKGKTSHLTGREQKSASTRLWNQLHTAFDVCSGMDIPEDQYNDARTFIASYAIEGEYLEAESVDQDRVKQDAECIDMFSAVARHRWHQLEKLAEQQERLVRKQEALLSEQHELSRELHHVKSSLYDPIFETAHRVRQFTKGHQVPSIRISKYVEMQDKCRQM